MCAICERINASISECIYMLIYKIQPLQLFSSIISVLFSFFSLFNNESMYMTIYCLQYILVSFAIDFIEYILPCITLN